MADSDGASRSSLEGDEGHEEESGGELDRDDCKIEGAQIGEEGTELQLGATTITFHDWIAKTGEPHELVGFSMTVQGAGSIEYVVKTGGERHPANALDWMHPAGPDGGPDAPGISNIDFCDTCEGGGCDEPDPDPDPEPDPDPDCTDPDGCPDDGGSGPLL